MVMSCPQIRSKEAKSKEDLKTLKFSKAFVVNLNITKLGRGRPPVIKIGTLPIDLTKNTSKKGERNNSYL